MSNDTLSEAEWKNQVLQGDCLEVLKRLPDESIDSCVTDPPYGLGTREPTADDIINYLKGGELDCGGDFMQYKWNIPSVAVWKEVYRVLKPGGYVLSFAGTRTMDLVSLGIRAAGFENRDTIASQFGPSVLQWVYGSGFPKSRDPLKSEIIPKLEELLSLQGVILPINWVYSETGNPISSSYSVYLHGVKYTIIKYQDDSFLLPSEISKWKGYGTATKPAWEPVLCYRKPLDYKILVKEIESCLSQLYVNFARLPFRSNLPDLGGVMLDSVHKNVENKCVTLEDSSEVTVTCALQQLTGMSLSTVLSWQNILVDLSKLESMSITKMGAGLITELRTLRSFLLRITQESMHSQKIQLSGLVSLVLNASQLFSDVEERLKNILTSSVLESVISLDIQSVREGVISNPQMEPILMYRKPIEESTVARQILKTGTGAINIDATRVKHASKADLEKHSAGVQAIKERGGSMGNSWKNSSDLSGASDVTDAGRWPANVLLNHSDNCTKNVDTWQCVEGCPVVVMDQQSGDRPSTLTGRADPSQSHGHPATARPDAFFGQIKGGIGNVYADGGGASRFFQQFEGQPEVRAPFYYSAKSSKRDKTMDGRVENLHPTTKPIGLMKYLVKMVTTTGGVVLDPYCGSGTTCVAALQEGFGFVGIERDEQWIPSIQGRLKYAKEDKEDREALQEALKEKDPEGPSFMDLMEQHSE